MKRLHCLTLLLVLWSAAASAATPEGDPIARGTRVRFPLLFTVNAGQWDRRVEYASLSPTRAIYFGRNGFTAIRSSSAHAKPLRIPEELSQRGVDDGEQESLTLEFVHPSGKLSVSAAEKVAALSNFYRGSDSTAWRSGVSNYAALRYVNVCDGIDVEYAERAGRLVQTCIARPGSDISQLRVKTRRSGGDGPAAGMNVRAYSVKNGDTTEVPIAQRTYSDGSIGFIPAGGDAPRPLYISSEFATYFGGSGDDWGGSLIVDGDGQISVSGTTASFDFPVKNAFQASLKAEEDIFVSRFDADGRTLLFSTYYGGSGGEWAEGCWWKGATWEHANAMAANMALGKGKSLYINGITTSHDLPLTANALQKSCSTERSGFLARFSSTGALLNGSYLSARKGCIDRCLLGPITLAIGIDSALIVAGYTSLEIECMPAGGYQPALVVPSGPEHSTIFVLRLSPECDVALSGTYFGGDAIEKTLNDWDEIAVAVDSHGSVIIASSTASASIPMLAAVDAELSGPSDLFIAKFDASLRSLVFSTYLGGSGREQVSNSSYDRGRCSSGGLFPADFYGWGRTSLAIDRHDNIVVAGVTNSTDLPVRAAFRPSLDTTAYPHFSKPDKSAYPYTDIVLARYASTGALLSCTYLGGGSAESPASIAFLPCGDLVLTGYTCSWNFPLVGTHDTSRTGMFLAVLDSSCAALRRSFILFPERSFNQGTLWPNVTLWSDGFQYKDGYAFFLGLSGGDIGAYNAFQNNRGGGLDATIQRLYLPLCDEEFVRCALSSLDTLIFDNTTGDPVNGPFDLVLEMENTDAARSAYGLEGDLTLPAGLILDPPNQSLHYFVQPSPLAPGQKWRHTWHVRIDSAVRDTQSVTFRTIGLYRATAGGDCSFLYTVACAKQVTVLHVPKAPLALSCILQGPSTLELNPQGDGYSPNPFTVTCTVKNASPYAVSNYSVALEFPSGQGLSTVPSGDTLRTIPRLGPDSSVILTWTISALVLPGSRTLLIRVVTRDSERVQRAECRWMIPIASLKRLLCAPNGPAVIRYDDSTGIYSPDPFQVSLSVRNPSDTAVTTLRVDLDISQAPYFAAAAGDSLSRTVPAMAARETAHFVWRLRVAGPVPATVLQRLFFRIRSDQFPDSQSCELVIPFAIPLPEGLAKCGLAISDSLRIAGDDTSYAPASIALNCRVQNIGNATLPAGETVLSVKPASALMVADSARRWLGPLSPGAEQSIVWNAVPRTSRFSRIVTCSVVVTMGGKAATRCEVAVFVPGIANDLQCAVDVPDTLHYSIATDASDPNPFHAMLTLRNHLDTTQAAIETEVDLAAAPHLRLAAGETAKKILPSIPNHGSAALSWMLEVSAVPPVPVVEIVTVHYRHTGDTAWKQCEQTILIEGAERITSAACSSMGHDTVWADAGYEAIIPDPVQVQYTITNTGNVPLAGCSAAILHSPMYALVNPADSIQAYPVVQPGGSASREWLLDPLLDHVQPVPEIVCWVWSCDKLAAAPQCTHSITLVAASPSAVVFTPWLLRFQAERNGPLPAAQELRLWTGGAAKMPWRLQSSTAWIDWQPSIGADSTRVMVVPNTTALPEGSHAGRIDMTALPGVSPLGIHVVYDITTKTGMDDVAAPAATMLGQNYPNPAAGYTTITAMLDRQSKARMLLYDAYGRLVAVVHDGELPEGRSSFQIDTKLLPSGMYWYSLVAGGRTEARMMMVVKR